MGGVRCRSREGGGGGEVLEGRTVLKCQSSATVEGDYVLTQANT